MDPISISISICLLLLSFIQTGCVGEDRLIANSSVTVNQTIVSAGGTFALGFFNRSTYIVNYYVGIWYNNLPGKEVVWVANRENSLKDSSGVLRITEDGNIALLDAKGSIVWSSNLSYVLKNSSAVLLDSGNLVLRDRDDKDLWQSFDHPTDTILPNMIIRRNFITGSGTELTSWKTAGDPQPGNFSYVRDPVSPLQYVILKGSEVHYRSRVWNGQTNTYRIGSTTSVYTSSLTDREIDASYALTDGFELARYVLDPIGTLRFLFWNQSTSTWMLIISKPSEPCDAYNRCGAFSYCSNSGASSLCNCLEGFVPKLQQNGNSSKGCKRQLPLKCDNSDSFLKSSQMKLPDKSLYIRNRSEAQCKAECSTNCQCTAYAYAYNNMTNDVKDQSRCLIWTGDLMDLEMDFLKGEDLYVCIVTSELVEASSSGKLLLIMLPLAFGILVIGILFFLLKKRLKQQGKERRSKTIHLCQVKMHYSFDRGKNAELPHIEFNTIEAATDNFAVANKLGEGGFGPVYKGVLLQGQEIAVKRLSKSSAQGYQEFKNEVELIAKLQHTNLVQLLGWCNNEDEKILIYEYLPNKSLDKFIFDPRQSAELDWKRRFKIIGGIASGLLYLHQYSRLRVIHRDLKTSNILLDGDLNPKISDFGLARIFGGSQTEANTEKIVGTYGYMAPEYAMNGLFSEKTDVFSFGVILLEIVSGRRSTGFYPYMEIQSLLGYAWNLWEEGRALELIDLSISSSIWEPEVVQCIQVGLLCVQENAADRPSMLSVVRMLADGITTLPSPKQPGFAIGRNASLSAEESKNELSRSTIEGR